MQHHKPECHVEIFVVVVAIFKVKVAATAHMIKIWHFLLYYRNCWFLGNQTWSDDTSLEARVSCWTMRLLCSKSRSQQWSKMSVNVCPDDIFWITKHFVTNFGMVMKHHEPECHAEFLLLLLSSWSRSQQGLMIKIWLSTIFWILGNQTWSDDISS